jgi:ribosomal protein S18 acetylase RimI-like enzyme
MNYVIREEVTEADIDAVRDIVESTSFFNDEELAIACELAEDALNRKENSGYKFLFYDIDGKTAAYSCYGHIDGTESSYDLYWIVVSDAFRGKGIGRDLLYMTEKKIRTDGGKRVYAETSSREQYKPTRHFYESNGYFKEAVIEDFYGEKDSKVIYTKIL